MRRWAVAAVLLAALFPTAAAQPEPEDVVETVCDLAPLDLPVCPPDEPAPAPAPAPKEDAPHAHDDAPPAAPDAPALVEDVREEVDGIVEDPASAPSRLASVVATLVQVVKDLLGLPSAALAALAEVKVEASASVSALAEEARSAVAALGERIADLFARPVADARVGERLPRVEDAASDASGLVDGLLQRVPSPMAR